MSRRLVGFSLIPVVLVLLVGAGVVAQSGDPKLDVRVNEYSLQADGLAEALIKVSKQFKIPIGVEWVRDRREIQVFNRSWNDKTVGNILRSIVDTYPEYDMRIEDGTVHVFRRELVRSPNNFLNIKVPDYFQTRREVGGLTNLRLHSVIQEIVSPRNLPPGAGHGDSYATGLEEKHIALALAGLNVRDALNKLIETSDYKMWIATFSDSLDLTSTGFRRTETLGHPSPFADSSQPMWDLLAWREYGPDEGEREHPE